MQLKCKVIRKWEPLPPISTSNPPFHGYPPFLAKLLLPPQVTQFLEVPTPHFHKGGGGGVPTMQKPQLIAARPGLQPFMDTIDCN